MNRIVISGGARLEISKKAVFGVEPSKVTACLPTKTAPQDLLKRGPGEHRKPRRERDHRFINAGLGAVVQRVTAWRAVNIVPSRLSFRGEKAASNGSGSRVPTRLAALGNAVQQIFDVHIFRSRIRT